MLQLRRKFQKHLLSQKLLFQDSKKNFLILCAYYIWFNFLMINGKHLPRLQ